MKNPILALSLALALAAPLTQSAFALGDDESSCSAEEFADGESDNAVVFVEDSPEEEPVEFSSERQARACSGLEEKLEQLQLMSFNVESDSFKAANKKLQEHFTAVCDNSQASEEKLAEVERDLTELDESMDYLTIFVAKKRSGGGGAPRILAPFKAQHNVCAPGCSYVSWGIWGDKAHQARASCHNSGDAIDIHAFRCGKTLNGPKTARFKKYVGCMRKKFGTVFGNASHKNHVHIQLKGCRKIRGTLQGK
jgi:hypothetical protein